MHDILHGVWHFENKILFTIKQAILRPGYAAIEYIEGKRIKYYNVFYMVALLLGISLFLSHSYDNYFGETFHVTHDPNSDPLNLLITKYMKIITLCFIPFAAINSYILFRKAQLNFPEHLIIAGFSFLGVVAIGLLYVLVSFLEILFKTPFPVFLNFAPPIIFLSIFSIAYYQAFKRKSNGIWWKLLLWILLMIIEFMTILLISAAILRAKA